MTVPIVEVPVAMTLADLTLKLSRDLGKLESRCEARRVRAGARKDDALEAIPSAAKARKAHHAAVERARKRKLTELQLAPDRRDEAIEAASRKRSDDHLAADRDHRRGRDRALSSWTRAKRDAKTRYDAARREAMMLPVWPSSSRGKNRAQALAEAEDDYRDALSKAQTSYEDAVEDAREEFRAELDRALDDERRLVRAANRAFNEALAGADTEYARGVQAADSALVLALRDDADASTVLDAHQARLVTIQAECSASKDDLFAKFEEDKKGLPD